VIPNGDKGDITTSVGGTIWTVDTGAVTEAKIASGAVTEAKIGSGAVIEAKIGTGAVAEAKIASGAVTETKIANGAVTVAKLASGFAPTVSSINDGPLAGLRNRIINGNFDVWQRGTSFTNSEYGADRWISGRVGSTHTATRQGFPVGFTDVPNNPTWYIRTVVSSVTGVSNSAYLTQLIEGVRTFAGQQATISFWARADSTKNISVELTQSFGGGSNSPSSPVNAIGVTKVSIGSTWQKVTVTASVPSISGKTIGDTGNDYLGLFIWFDAGSSLDARTNTLGHQSGTFEIAQVQIEPGSAATPFERRSIGLELELCYRYFQLLTYYGGAYTGANVCYFVPEGFNKFRADPAISSTVNGFQFFNNTNWVSASTGTGASFSIYTSPIGTRAIQVNGLANNGTTIPTPTSAAILGTLSAEL
jgi:hypothetical protein